MANHLTRISHCLPRLGVLATLGIAMLLSSCTSSGPKIRGVPSNLPDIPVYGKARTPPHSLARADYPFDSNGNYVTAWAAEGRSSAGPSDYRRSSHHDDDDAPPRRRTTSSSSSSSSKKKISSTPPKKSSSSTAKKSTSGSGSSTRHTVKSGDSLWGLAKKYGTTVEKIKSANGLKGTTIRDGASLRIPK